MLTFSSLKQRLNENWTTLQLQDEAKKYIGQEIAIEFTTIVELYATSDSQVTVEIGHGAWSDNSNYFLHKDRYANVTSHIPEINSKLRLLNKGDHIKFTAKLTDITFGLGHTFFFELLSFEKIMPPPLSEAKEKRDALQLVPMIVSSFFLFFTLYILFTEHKNGYWFHDTVGLFLIKIGVVIFSIMTAFFIYAYIKRIK